MNESLIKIWGEVFSWLKELFQPTFRFWQNQQHQSFIESTLQRDGSAIAQINAEVLVANNTDQRLSLVKAHLDKPKLGEINAVHFLPNRYIPARAILPVRVLIFIKKKIKRERRR
jgi:hypothetical protein